MATRPVQPHPRLRLLTRAAKWLTVAAMLVVAGLWLASTLVLLAVSTSNGGWVRAVRGTIFIHLPTPANSWDKPECRVSVTHDLRPRLSLWTFGVSWTAPHRSIELPLWLPALLIAGAAWGMHRLDARVAIAHRRLLSSGVKPCPFCNYDLRGTSDGSPCPECGRDSPSTASTRA